MLSNNDRSARELAFRTAAANNDTNTMITLSKSVDVNGIGTGEGSSKKTAAHRAAEALRLLFNLGADFSLQDSKNKTPLELVPNNKKEALLCFKLIDNAKQALEARKQFFPATTFNQNWSEAEKLKHSKTHEALLNAIQYGPLTAKLHTSYKREAKLNTDYLIEDAERFMDEYDVCVKYLQSFEGVKTLLEKCYQQEKLYCACGDAAFCSFSALVHRDRVPYSVDVLNIISRIGEGGHACVILGRDTAKSLAESASLKTTLVLDPAKELIFFYQFVEQVQSETVLKVLQNFDLMPGVTNQQPAFPKVMKFPDTKRMYQEMIEKIKCEGAKLLCDRRDLMKAADTSSTVRFK
jgi:hypothetical protein